MNTRKSLAAVFLALGTTIATSALAGPVIYEHGPDLVTNGGFETGDFAGWSASVDPVFSGVDGAAAHSGSFGAYFGDAGIPGSISQSISTLLGGQYNIHLWLRSDGLTPNSLEVLWGGVSVYSATDLDQFAYMEIVIDPMGLAGSTMLELRLRNDTGFLELDDVSVFQVPEPISLALLGAGLFGMGFVRRRAA